MYRWYYISAALAAALCLHSSIAADALKCTEEELMYAPGNSSLFCVFRGVLWRPGTPEPVFEESTAVRVALVDSNITAVPESFYARFPRLDIFLANNVSLEQLKIKNGMQVVYAEQNRIKQVEIDGGQSLKELHLKDNPLPSIGAIANLKSLEVLDVSQSKIAEMNSDTVDFKMFAQMDSLKELYLSNLEAYYFENEKKVGLPSLTRLDLSRNPIIPVNFHLTIFSGMPKLEELSLLGTNMGDLNVRNIRDELPALKRINIAGNNFPCSFMKMFLAHLKEKNVEVLGATAAVRCDLGYDKMEGFCCQSDGNFFPPPPPITEKPTGNLPETPSTSTAPNTGETPSINAGTSQEVPKTDSGTSEEGSSLTVIIVSVVVVIVVLAVAAFVGIYLKRRTEATHKAVPRNDPNENL